MKYIVAVILIFHAFSSSCRLSFKEENYEDERLLRIKFAENCNFKIQGQTNVNSFECDCNDQRPFERHVFYGTVGKGKIDFQDAVLSIPVSSISCGNKLMDSDLYELLNYASHPNIEVQFLNAQWDVQALWNNDLKKEESIGHFNVIVTISGVSRKEKIYISTSEIDNDNYVLATSGEVNMKLRDFEIEPPVKFMGLVKVEDEINLELDLNFQWSEAETTSE